MPWLRFPIYIIQSPNGLLFSKWANVTRYVKPGVTIFQAIYAFHSDKPGVDDMRQFLGLAEIDRSNLDAVPGLMHLWKDQEKGYAYLDSLDTVQRRRLEARKRRAIRRGLQQMREGKVFTEREVDVELQDIVDDLYDQESAKLAIVEQGLKEIEDGDLGVPHEIVMKSALAKLRKRFSERGE